MSRMNFDSTRGANAKIHEFGREVSRAINEKEPVSERSARMFQHKPYSNDFGRNDAVDENTD